ncbi:MAG: NfeD family protein [Chloroflexota bacterium]
MTRLARRRSPSPLPLILALLGLLAMAAASLAADPVPPVRVLSATGVVDQVMETYLVEGLARAEQDGAAAVVIRLDTPGGSLASTRRIVQAMLDARVPVITWVGPAGARAASAGTFITLAANVAAMAPSTNIGAATPVGPQGQDLTGSEGFKVMNDTVAWAKALAETRDRPVGWVVSAVRYARSDTVDEALAAGAVDLKASTLGGLLAAVDGMKVVTAAGEQVLATADAPVAEESMNPLQSFLHLLADPDIAFVLFTLGFLALLVELVHPNLVTGILGAFALILAFVGFGSLPLNVAGLLLVVLGIVLFVLELTITSHGLLAVGGLIAFVLGASALYRAPATPGDPSVAVAVPVIGAMTVLTAAFLAAVITAALRTRRMPKVNIGVADKDRVLLAPGTEGVVRRPLTPVGTIVAAGEEWSARTADGRVLERDSGIRVIGQDGLVLLVDALPADVPGPAAHLGPVI